MEYRIDSEKVRVMGGEIIMWKVFSGKQEPSNYLKFVKDKVVYSSESIADCYAWIKVKQEGLMFKEESIEQSSGEFDIENDVSSDEEILEKLLLKYKILKSEYENKLLNRRRG